MWTIQNWLGRNKTMTQMWKEFVKEVDLGEPTSILEHVYLDYTQRECQTSKDIVAYCRNMFESKISAGTIDKLLRNLAQTCPHGPMTWKDMQRNAWNDIANWRTQQLNSFSKSHIHALTTINSRKKKWDLLENCQKFAYKLF